MDHELLHRRVREQGANRLVYWLVRAVFQPFFHIYFRFSRIGREHIPTDGPVIIAANHRSFLDPFVIGTMVRRPMYYVAKKEIFTHPCRAWILSALGAFPVDRGASDTDMVETAKKILARGDVVLIFPEGTRIRPGSLGHPKRGVGRLALETGAPVVPVAVIGCEGVRRGWRVRPRKVRIRAGRALRFPRVQDASPALAGAVTDRIWPCVMLQWEWLGGLPPIRRAVIVGAGSWGTGLAVCLARAGFEVDLGCRTHEEAVALAGTRENPKYLPGTRLPDSVRVLCAAELKLGDHDLVCLAVPARSLPAVLAAHGERIPNRAGVLVVSKGLVPPLGTLPSAFASERCRVRAVAVLGGPSRAAGVLEHGASVSLASLDRGFARQLADAFGAAGIDASITPDVTGVELAGCARGAGTARGLSARPERGYAPCGG
jgi:glycerol-3-phosphate dehydrogenase (NAD(P)+)